MRISGRTYFLSLQRWWIGKQGWQMATQGDSSSYDGASAEKDLRRSKAEKISPLCPWQRVFPPVSDKCFLHIAIEQQWHQVFAFPLPLEAILHLHLILNCQDQLAKEAPPHPFAKNHLARGKKKATLPLKACQRTLISEGFIFYLKPAFLKTALQNSSRLNNQNWEQHFHW